MGRRRKDYTFRNATGAAVSIDDYRDVPWVQRWQNLTFDFRRWRYIGRPVLDASEHGVGLSHAGRDRLVEALRDGVWRMTCAESTKGACCGGLVYFLEFLDDCHAAGDPVSGLAQIDKRLLERFIHWLRYVKAADTQTGRLSYNSAKNVYAATKRPLQYLVSQGALAEGIFPGNPFPNARRAVTSYTAYPKPVMSQLLYALGQDLRGLRDDTLSLRPSAALTVYLLLIAARSGRNPEPLLSAKRDALQPHPVKPAQMGLLVVYKNRGNTAHAQAFPYVSRQVEDMVSLPMDAVTLFHEVSCLTAPLVAEAPASAREQLWLYRPVYGPNRGQVTTLSAQNYLDSAKWIVERHGLQDEDGQPLRINISRLRATFVQRMWQLTGGDILKTARLAGNAPQVSDRHYLAVTPEMEGNHRRLGHLMHADLSGSLKEPNALAAVSKEVGIPVDQLPPIATGEHNTGVGRCRDPKHGAKAPGDGSDCTRWLGCFSCPDQVVMESDLYRLYSFYFLLMKERNFLQRRHWEALYGPIVQIIDHEIVGPNLRTEENPRGCFDPLRVKRMRERAERDPHPMWRDRAILAIGGSHAEAA